MVQHPNNKASVDSSNGGDDRPFSAEEWLELAELLARESNDLNIS